MIRIKTEKLALAGALALTAGLLAWNSPLTAQAATGTVTSSNVKVRAEASTSSDQVSSLDSGDKVDIIDEATDSQGYVWYRIYVNGNEYGYVRSDLISKSGDTSSSSQAAPAASLPKTEVTAVEQQTATVTVASANVRSGAGTGYDTVGTVANGDTVTITGEANGTDSKKWYQVSFGSSGRTGFVRADLVQIGAPAPAESTDAPAEGEVTEGAEGEVVEGAEGAAEGEAVENPEGEAPAEEAAPVDTSVIGNGEYSLAYKDDGSGTEVWYLYDNVDGTQVKLNDLLSYAAAGQQADKLKEQVGKLKVVMIIMAIIIALLVLAVLLLIYRLRDYAYYEEDEEADNKGRKNDRYDDAPATKNTKSAREPKTVEPARSNGRTVADSKRPEKPERTVTPTRDRKSAPMGTAASLLGAAESSDRKPSQAVSNRVSDLDEQPVRKPSVGRKSRNFLLEDDDFEFEFLDLDDDEK